MYATRVAGTAALGRVERGSFRVSSTGTAWTSDLAAICRKSVGQMVPHRTRIRLAPRQFASTDDPFAPGPAQFAGRTLVN